MSERQLSEVREPQQERSRKRTNQILDAAQKIILEKGCANLTIGEIAQVAAVTPGSIYQYFRNKNEIVVALAARFGLIIHEMFQDVYAVRPKNLHEHAKKLLQVMNRYFQIHADNPAIFDVWAGAATDKAMQALSQEEADQNMRFHMELAKPFFPEEVHDELYRTLRLLMQYGVHSSHLALEFHGDERRKLLDTAERMIMDCWWPFVTKNALPEFLEEN
ncbi:MAG: TetR/AcrR family transcriptional regulator [Cellvibrio sp.]